LLEENELLIGDSIGKVYLFPDLQKMSNAILLKNDNNAVFCIECFNIFCTGKKDILIGTSKNLQIYSFKDGKYELSHEISFPFPIYSLKCLDVNQDGCVEIVVLTMKSLHIMRPDLSDILLKKLEIYFEIK
jgi:hypothetical protein